MKCSPGISNFLEISSLSHSIVFLYFFALVTKEGFLISPCYSLELCIQIGISFLFSFAFNFFFQVFVSPPQTTILPFCISFPWGWSWSLPPVQCHKPPSMVLQALSLSIKDRNGVDLTEAEILRRGGKNTQNNYTKKIFMTQITTMVWSLTLSQTSWNSKSSGP